MNDALFPLPPTIARPMEAAPAEARLLRPNRQQLELRPADLDGLLPAEHRARVVWHFVEGLDLGPLYAQVKAVEGHAGRPAIDPAIRMALWLNATLEGVGSARALARLCESHDAYRWLCGGVSVNYHGLSDFRTAHPELLERLLTEHVAALSVAEVIDLDEVVQAGVRVRASAGTKSFRRKKKLYKELKKARRLVERLRQEAESDPAASNRRIAAAQERAAREREARVAAALAKHRELEAERARRAKTNKKQTAEQKDPRTSTTDPQARVMKMADGGFRPAYNCQIATVAKGQIVIGVSTETVGSDRGLLRPMLDRVKKYYSRLPKRHLVDGGFNKNDDTEWAANAGVKVYGPATNNKHKSDPYAPRRDDKPGVAAWRRRMSSPHGKGVYKRRAMGECINARFRQWRLYQFTVRGREKVNTLLHWFALANNILAGHRLRTA